MQVHDRWSPHIGYITVGARDYAGDGRYDIIQVTIVLAHIVAIEWRWELLDWSKEGKEFVARVQTTALEGAEGCSSFSRSYQVTGEDARALYRAYTQQQPPATEEESRDPGVNPLGL